MRAIILFTLIIKLLMLPLSIKQHRTMKKSTKLQEEMLKRTESKEGDAIFFIAESTGRVEELAGQIRTELGKRLNLIKDDKFEFCWIVDFPMYELKDGKIQFSHNPFSMPQGGMEDLITKNPLEILAYQYDLVCDGVELSSGAVRNHDIEIMIKLSPSVYKIKTKDDEVVIYMDKDSNYYHYTNK